MPRLKRSLQEVLIAMIKKLTYTNIVSLNFHALLYDDTSVMLTSSLRLMLSWMSEWVCPSCCRWRHPGGR